jgi:hypothetical protein
MADLDKGISQLKFDPVVPPRLSLQPGTVVSVVHANPYVLKIICEESDALGPGVVVSTSSTVSQDWTQKTGTQFEADASYKDTANAKFGANSVRKITFQLSTPSVPEMATDEVDKAVARHGNSAACVSAIRRAQANHETVTMLYTGLIADVVYTIDYDEHVSADAKAQITQDIAAHLNLDHEQTGTETIKGTGLIWGVLDDKTLIDPLLGTHRVRAGSSTEHFRLIPMVPVAIER